MKRVLLSLLFLGIFISAQSQNINVDEARKLYPKSVESKEQCNKLYEKLSEIDEKNQNLLLGYKGAVMAAMAKFEKEPPQKLKFFKEGKRKLDTAILNDLENIELRFLRLSIQMHTPTALHYNDKIADDKEFINANIQNIKNEKLKKSIADYMAEINKTESSH